MEKVFFSIFALLGLVRLGAQTHLDGYVQQGLTTNESIRQQQFLLQKSRYALAESKALFWPNVNINTTYTLAGGGRTVDIPVGDLVNPVYATLNQLTASNTFPKIRNQSVLLNPDNFYDLRARTTYPLFNPDLSTDKKIKEKQRELQETEVHLFKRELVKEIKVAYYQYLQSLEGIAIYKAALKQVNENLRINTSLYINQKVNRTAVIRAENEVAKISSVLETAIHMERNAKARFNFLLNKPLASTIEKDTGFALPVVAQLADTAIGKREELQKLRQSRTIKEHFVVLSKSYKLPKLNSFADVGIQGFDFTVNKKAAYYLLGFSMEWNLFSGGKNLYNVKQRQADLLATSAEEKYVEEQLRLQVLTATNSFSAAVAKYKASTSQTIASQKYYSDLLKLYKEGQVLFIEVLDGLNQLVSAQIEANISLFDIWIKAAEIERANAGFIIQ